MDNGKFNFEYFSNLYNSHLYVTAINYALDHLENNSEIISLINHKVIPKRIRHFMAGLAVHSKIILTAIGADVKINLIKVN